MQEGHFGVGVGVIVRRRSDGFFLLGLRQGSHGHLTWGLPGGSLHYGETVEQCATRELLEETSLTCQDGHVAPFSTWDVMENKAWLTLYYSGFVDLDDDKKIEVVEKDKCLEWRWCSINDMPQPLFQPLQSAKSQLTEFLNAGK